MRLIATMPVRDDEWVLGLSLRAVLLWCDTVVVLLHRCNDATRAIVEEVIREQDRGRVIVLHESNPVWDEMPQRQAMLESARRNKATHIAIVDSDEVLSGNLIASVPLLLRWNDPRVMLQLPLYYMRGSLTRYHANGIWGNRIVDVVFQDHDVAHWGGDCFHSRAPRGIRWFPSRPVSQADGGVMHLWGCSEARLKAKCALYKLTERLRWPDKNTSEIERMYNWAIRGETTGPQYDMRRYGTPAIWTYSEAPESWYAPYKQWLKYVDTERNIWQREECRKIVAKHPGITEGLDLFGVID